MTDSYITIVIKYNDEDPQPRIPKGTALLGGEVVDMSLTDALKEVELLEDELTVLGEME